VCAQALYDGQLLAARDEPVRKLLSDAAREETEHLAWTERRLNELGGRKSLLDPLFYTGSFALGAAAGLLGDRWSLGFLAETERQVEQHLEVHLGRLPEGDRKSRAILSQMQADEAGHSVNARRQGGGELPAPVRGAMRVASRIMTGTSRWI
jgi:ubiquinone biosynthesis monooxygenase Coq7